MELEGAKGEMTRRRLIRVEGEREGLLRWWGGRVSAVGATRWAGVAVPTEAEPRTSSPWTARPLTLSAVDIIVTFWSVFLLI